MINRQEVEIDGRKVAVSNLEKIYYPKVHFTKGQMLLYYSRISPVLLPHLQGRPLTMKRYPNGVDAPFFYEKQCPRPIPAYVKTFQVARHHRSGSIRYCLVNNLSTLLWAANLADLEMHTFLARAPHLDRPTQIVFDLDPGPPADIIQCAEVALLLRRMFANLDLEVFVKASGSKGLQVYLPLNTPVTYEQTTPFAKAVAQTLADAQPKLVVADMKKALRRGKVLVDWSQNSETKTTISVYSLRAKERPFVSLPLEWSEVEKCLKKKQADLLFFEAEASIRRVEKKGDLFAPVLTLKQRLPSGIESLQSLPSTRKKKVPLRGTGDGSISAYHAKRDFTQTTEPSGKKRGHAKKPLFVIQKHDASHLHYDFRLELDGVLKSWAVPKGPQTDLQTKRLAMMVEDHPYEYARFEGTIPKGNYGAGTVMVWDIGTWENLGPEPHEGLKSGKLHFRLKGKKLNGEWALVKMHGRYASKGNEWLLLKHGQAMKPISPRRDNSSALTGRSMEKIAGPHSKKWLSGPRARQSGRLD